MSLQQPPHQLSVFLEEYKEIGANLRHYGNMRFAQLTLFVAVSGGLLAAVFGRESGLSVCQKMVVEFLGLLLTCAFWAMEESASQRWKRYYDRATQLEKELASNQYTPPKPDTEPSATWAVRFIYLVVALVWFALLVLSISGLTYNLKT